MSDAARDQALAQMASVCAMVAALEVDYDRLQELREKRAMPRFVAGRNMPGYMPDNEPASFDSAEDARAYIADEMEQENDDVPEDAVLECRNGSGEYGATFGNWHYWVTQDGTMLDDDPDEVEELAELEEAAGDCESEDAARQRIEEDALSVEVRSSWTSVGEDLMPEEFRIVLCTGGPHVEIVGDLDESREPSRVRVIYKDWSESGELFDFDHDAVLTYCRCFFFGE